MSGSETFVLELLPARGLDQSMLLPVLVGLLVVLLFTETFGWVFAGAVVPGYLASVLIIQPVTGAIVIFESLVTLTIAAVIARGLSETDAWSRFFGRERFFLILVVSLVVRIHDHAWFAPWAIATLDAKFGTVLETQQEFYSVGLVLVPLTANMLWKPAIHRGLLQLAVQVGITYLIVLFVLLPYTNLTLSSVELTYENAAVNFIGHAKAHIILLTAALLAAQFNLTYGWDFNGILVPALLAMLWLTPFKLLATIGEAIVVLYLVRGFLRLPVVRHLDFEGPRKITLVFTLAFVWKLALGFTLAPLFPDLKISDTYGFGYLLSSLLAVKMLGRKSVRAVMLPSLTASAGGFLLGSLAGFLLDVAAPELPPDETITRPASARLASSPLGVMTLARMQIEVQREDPLPPSQAELHQLQRFWAEVAKLGREPAQTLPGFIASLTGESGASTLDPLRHRAATLGLQIVELGRYPGVAGREPRTWLGIVEQDGPGRRGFATGLVIPEARGPVLVVPMPAREAPVAEAAALACRRVDCRAVLVAGRELPAPGTEVSPRPLEIAMAAFEDAKIVILRADMAGGERSLVARLLPQESVPVEPRERTPTRIHPLRGYFDLAELWPDYELDWQPRETLVRPPPGDGDFVLVRTTPAQLEAMVLIEAHELVDAERASLAPTQRDATELLATLTEIHEQREPPGLAGAGYVPPSTAELSLLEQEIVEPLIEWAQTSRTAVAPPPGIAVRAAELDYELVEFGDCRSPALDDPKRACAVMLREREHPSTTGWGSLVVRRGPKTMAATIEVPRPYREFETWRIGAELWQISRASALLIAGADGLPRASRRAAEPSFERVDAQVGAVDPDPVRPGNLGTPFQAFHQAIERSSTRGRARDVVQIRGLAAYHAIERDLAVGLGQPGNADAFDQACWDALDARLAVLVEAWGSCRIADGSKDLYMLSGAGIPQLEYSRELRNREVRALWLSAGLRERFRTDRGLPEIRGLRQAEFEPEPVHELEVLLAPLAKPGPGRGLGRRGFERAIELAVVYAETDNLHVLRELRALRLRGADLRVEAGIGLDWSRPFLLVEWTGEQHGARALISLDHLLEHRVELSADEFDDDADAIAQLQTAALGRPLVLLVDELPLPETKGGGPR